MIEKIVLHWHADFRGRGQSTLELTYEDQDDPRLKALYDWWEERMHAKVLAAGPQGDLFTGT